MTRTRCRSEIQITFRFLRFYVFYHDINAKGNVRFPFRVPAEKGVADTYIDASSVVWTLIDNGKLANQIAKLAAVVIKIKFFAHARLA